VAASVYYKIQLDVDGNIYSKNCLDYDADEAQIQNDIDSLYDFNLDGIIDEDDAGRILVERAGDNSGMSGYGYSYEFVFRGSRTTKGASIILGNSAMEIRVVDVGSEGGCSDTGGGTVVASTTGTTVDSAIVVSFDSALPKSLSSGIQ
jgi:hypothetical protein